MANLLIMCGRIKAAADSAVIWCAERYVISHTSKICYGVEINQPYGSNNPERAGRIIHKHDTGYNYVTGKWPQIVGKVRFN